MTLIQAAEKMREACAGYLESESEVFRNLKDTRPLEAAINVAVANVLSHKAQAIRALDAEEILK